MRIDTAEIKARVSLIDTMERDGHTLIRTGGLVKCRCPFHVEKNPSCIVYPDGHFHCFGCGANGDVIGYVMKRDGIPFRAALEKLAGHAPTEMFRPIVPIPPRERPPLADAAGIMQRCREQTDFDDLDLFAFELNLSVASLSALGCAWLAPGLLREAPSGAWAFPMLDHTGMVTGIRLRDTTGYKFAVTGSKEGLFFGELLKGKLLVICEGPTDCAAGITMGLNVVGRPSCQGAVQELVRLITGMQFREVLIVSDNDGPGLAGSERLQSHLPCPYREIVLPCKDLREFLKLGGTKQLIDAMAANQLPRMGVK